MSRVLFVLLLLAASAGAHGGTAPPPPEEPPPPAPRARPKQVEPPPPPPEVPQTPTETPDAPATPSDGPHAPTTPSGPPDPRTGGLPRRSGAQDTSWRLWWEYNREHLVGFRAMLRAPGVVTGEDAARRRDPLGPRRPQVLETLRLVARRESDRTLRAAALIALGRTGERADAGLFVSLLKDRSQPTDVLEAAAVGLGLLPDAGGDDAREWLRALLRGRADLPSRAHGMAVMSAGLRARRDPVLAMELAGACAGRAEDADDAAHLAVACGLSGNSMVVPELVVAVGRGRIAEQRLTDVGRAHAVYALGRTGEPFVVDAICDALSSRRSGVDTKRAAALALARLFRDGLPEDAARRAAATLRRTFDDSNDVVLAGFCAVALGAAGDPAALAELMHAVDRGGNAGKKPYAALGLGLAAPRASERDAARIRTFLRDELDKTHDPELGSALSVAAGLAGAGDAAPLLAERLGKRSLPDQVRGAAAQGLGLLGRELPEAVKALEDVARNDDSSELVQDAVLALGLLGRRGIAKDLVAMLPRASSSRLQGRILLALAHLGHEDAVDPLLAVLANPREKGIVREFAAVALGILGDRRDEDVLFAVDAHFNYFATTPSTNELIRLY